MDCLVIIYGQKNKHLKHACMSKTLHDIISLHAVNLQTTKEKDNVRKQILQFLTLLHPLFTLPLGKPTNLHKKYSN